LISPGIFEKRFAQSCRLKRSGRLAPEDGSPPAGSLRGGRK
jgi:hypothetical protein